VRRDARKNASRIQKLLSLSQDFLQFPDMRQGMTLVVPQIAHSDSGFSRCGVENN
jgi:hypothetical protein